MDDEIRIVRGRPTEEELAALVSVLLARGQVQAPVRAMPESRWSRSARPRSLRRGPAGWRASALPR